MSHKKFSTFDRSVSCLRTLSEQGIVASSPRRLRMNDDGLEELVKEVLEARVAWCGTGMNGWCTIMELLGVIYELFRISVANVYDLSIQSL